LALVALELKVAQLLLQATLFLQPSHLLVVGSVQLQVPIKMVVRAVLAAVLGPLVLVGLALLDKDTQVDRQPITLPLLVEVVVVALAQLEVIKLVVI
jgi:hypothetical protein